jgi:hypothetical protein
MAEFIEGFTQAWGMLHLSPVTVGRMFGVASMICTPVVVIVAVAAIASACISYVRKRFEFRRSLRAGRRIAPEDYSRPARRPRGR